jgi:hypothetical protein
VFVLILILINGCGEVSGIRRYKVEIFIHESPNSQVTLSLHLPEISKKYDTNPNINPNLEIPLLKHNPETGEYKILIPAE